MISSIFLFTMTSSMDHALISDIAGNLLKNAGFEFNSIDCSDEGDIVRVNVVCDQPSRIIGWHGATLNAFQHLLKAALRTQLKLERAPHVLLDTDGYRSTQEDKVRAIAKAKADFVRRTGNRVALSPMSPYFRRIVHLYIAGDDAMADLTSESIGQGDYRQVVLKLKDEKKAVSPKGEELTPVMDDSGDDGLDNLDL